MARISGRRGRLYVGLASDTAPAEPILHLTNWALNFSGGTIDVTAMGDENMESVGGFPEASGSYSGRYDTVSPQLYTAATDRRARRFYLYPTIEDTGTYYWGTAIFDMNIEGSYDGPVNISGDFSAASTVRRQPTA